jgi:hypothetical protein
LLEQLVLQRGRRLAIEMDRQIHGSFLRLVIIGTVAASQALTPTSITPSRTLASPPSCMARPSSWLAIAHAGPLAH